jgi:hypothetical protein
LAGFIPGYPSKLWHLNDPEILVLPLIASMTGAAQLALKGINKFITQPAKLKSGVSCHASSSSLQHIKSGAILTADARTAQVHITEAGALVGSGKYLWLPGGL